MDKNPYIGQMDRKIVIQNEVFTHDADTNEEIPTFETVITPFAFMEEASGDEDVEGKVRHLISRRYTIRYNEAVKTSGNKLKLMDGSLQYNVYHVKELGRKRHLQLLVTNYE